MPSLQLVACRAFPYAGGSVASGQRFTAKSEHDAFILKRIGHATDIPEAASVGVDISSAEDRTALVTVLPEPVKPKRVYRRRVKQADE